MAFATGEVKLVSYDMVVLGQKLGNRAMPHNVMYIPDDHVTSSLSHTLG